jgi:hypothetical protein
MPNKNFELELELCFKVLDNILKACFCYPNFLTLPLNLLKLVAESFHRLCYIFIVISNVTFPTLPAAFNLSFIVSCPF